jgi:uncharacterized heparinase superfamily protein
LTRTVAHLRPAQVAARVHLTAKRRAWPAGGRIGLRWRDRVQVAGVSPTAPQPALPPCRGHVVGSGENRRIVLPGAQHPLRLPLDWHPPELEHGTRLAKLHLHYMEFLEDLPADEALHFVEDWVASNRPVRRGYWLDAWNAYCIAIRSVVWMRQHARHREAWHGVDTTLLESLAAQLRFLARNLETDIGGNHAIKDARALIWGGAFFTGRDAAEWRRAGERLLERELARQVLGDGVHFERSPSYHVAVTADLLDCVDLVRPVLRERLLDALRRMGQAAADLAHPDGAVAQFNDAGLTMAPPVQDVLAATARATGARSETRSVFGFPDAGYYGARLDDVYAVVDCGPVGPPELLAHAHADVLSFELSVRGRRLIVDQGVYEYNAGALRQASRATRSHNTVTVDGADQAEIWSAFRVGRTPDVRTDSWVPRDDGFSLTGSHDGFRTLPGRPMHRRDVDVAPTRVEVHDRVDGHRPLAATSSLLLHPSVNVEPFAGGLLLRTEGVEASLVTDLPHSVEDAVWWPDLGTGLPTRRILLDLGRVPCEGRFTLELH